ncbi:MAG: right-handed parallel beta-helix repeat-containing protein [Chloroflexota bacterium]
MLYPIKSLATSAVALAAIASLSFPGHASAAEFHVSTAAEFQAALEGAGANGEEDTIYLAPGTYYGAFKYEPVEAEHRSVCVRGEIGTGPGEVILDGQGGGRVLELRDYTAGPIATFRLQGITVRNGQRSNSGGGVYVMLDAYDVEVVDCIIRDNVGANYGGGIYVDTDESVTLENNLIIDNTVVQGYG